MDGGVVVCGAAQEWWGGRDWDKGSEEYKAHAVSIIEIVL
jgi:hypothetical protein